jgi:hypothetical protein
VDGADGGSGAEFVNHSCDPNLLRSLLVGIAIFYTLGNQADYAPVVLVCGLITNTLTAFLLIRFGLLVVVGAGIFNDILRSFPLTTQMSSWYAGTSLAGILLLAAIALSAFFPSLGADRISVAPI